MTAEKKTPKRKYVKRKKTTGVHGDPLPGEPPAPQVMRNEKGHFLKGSKCNPGGRRGYDPKTKEILMAAAPDAAQELVKMIKNPKTKDNTRLKAIEVLLNRVFGRPATEKTTEETQSETIKKLVDVLVAKQEPEKEAPKDEEVEPEGE